MENKRKQWFIDRVGQTIYRNKTQCDCITCEAIYQNGLLIHDKQHAQYLADAEAEMSDGKYPVRYFDTEDQAMAFQRDIYKKYQSDYLFRGKKKHGASWVYGNLVRDEQGLPLIAVYDKEHHTLVYHQVLAETIGQYIREEFAGEQIYEGDIIEIKNPELSEDHQDEDDELTVIGVITFVDGGYCLDYQSEAHGDHAIQLHLLDMETATLLGNVTDNAELLTKK